MLLTAIVNFLLVAAAIYFVIVMPMNHMIERRNRRLGINQDVKEEAAEDPQSPCSPKSAIPSKANPATSPRHGPLTITVELTGSAGPDKTVENRVGHLSAGTTVTAHHPKPWGHGGLRTPIRR